MDDEDILVAVSRLVTEEHELRSRVQGGSVTPADEQERLTRLEQSLDQCWDLLRQRRARREAGQDPDDAQVRDVREVEGYRQ
jgi:hypothetical protein